MELAVNVEGEFDFFGINDTLGEYQFVEKSVRTVHLQA